MTTPGPFVFNRWTVAGIPSDVCAFAACIIEIRVTNASGQPDWLSRRGCSPSPHLPCVLPYLFGFSLCISLKRRLVYNGQTVGEKVTARAVLSFSPSLSLFYAFNFSRGSARWDLRAMRFTVFLNNKYEPGWTELNLRSIQISPLELYRVFPFCRIVF